MHISVIFPIQELFSKYTNFQFFNRQSFLPFINRLEIRVRIQFSPEQFSPDGSVPLSSVPSIQSQINSVPNNSVPRHFSPRIFSPKFFSPSQFSPNLIQSQNIQSRKIQSYQFSPNNLWSANYDQQLRSAYHDQELRSAITISNYDQQFNTSPQQNYISLNLQSYTDLCQECF